MPATRKVPRYLSHSEVAKRIGVKSRRSVSLQELPPHDVEVGTHKGWKPETIDAWHAERPGRGFHGSRHQQ
ncbi:DNA binding protein [Mycobacterium phage LilMcDreamy]|uniref:Helix-turn-helix DNA binding domain protein n=1 Tax=Mycobacterium phage LilMcDreamy TaxID=2652422 RepID=A0A5P8D7J7_9CAUD|nr:DNA binding protein [Mycobacterium phage LilMcDreamy]QFP94661.1 helix-turn-helix DNA binding domain protein [Mycobacterium phage LilMcDreamy]